ASPLDRSSPRGSSLKPGRSGVLDEGAIGIAISSISPLYPASHRRSLRQAAGLSWRGLPMQRFRLILCLLSASVLPLEGTSASADRHRGKEFPIPTPSSGPAGITVGPDGNLWFTESAAPVNKIGRVSTSGVFAEFPVPTPHSGPLGITAGPDGNLWFTEQF